MSTLDRVVQKLAKFLLLVSGYFVLIWLTSSIYWYNGLQPKGSDSDFLLHLVMPIFSPVLFIYIIGAVVAAGLHIIISSIFLYTPRS